MSKDTQARPIGINITGWTPKSGQSLCGFADIQLNSGLRILGVGIFTANGKSWASLPSKPIIGADGAAKRDNVTGKVRYAPILEWLDRATADRFSIAVIDALDALHPGAVRS